MFRTRLFVRFHPGLTEKLSVTVPQAIETHTQLAFQKARTVHTPIVLTRYVWPGISGDPNTSSVPQSPAPTVSRCFLCSESSRAFVCVGTKLLIII